MNVVTLSLLKIDLIYACKTFTKSKVRAPSNRQQHLVVSQMTPKERGQRKWRTLPCHSSTDLTSGWTNSSSYPLRWYPFHQKVRQAETWTTCSSLRLGESSWTSVPNSNPSLRTSRSSCPMLSCAGLGMKLINWLRSVWRPLRQRLPIKGQPKLP